MFRGIFDKHRGDPQRDRDNRGLAAAAPTLNAAAGRDVTSPADVGFDNSDSAVSRELSALSQVRAPQSAKERGWTSLQRELERHPVKPAVALSGAGVVKKASRASQRGTAGWVHRSRWALGGVAAAVAVVAALLGTYSGGLLQTADSGNHPSTVTSVATNVTLVPNTTASTDGAATSIEGTSSTDGTQPGTTQGTTVSGSSTTQASTPRTTDHPGTTGISTSTSNTNTTLPPSTSTTGEQQNAAAQREGSAKAAARYLAELVVTGNASGARGLVDAGAQASLVQMMMSLREPHGYTITGAYSLNADTVRVTLDIDDRVVNNQGELAETVKHFVIRVLVGEDGAVIVAIAGS
jgi:hypothetical protein